MYGYRLIQRHVLHKHLMRVCYKHYQETPRDRRVAEELAYLMKEEPT
jgi:hypothetical protein